MTRAAIVSARRARSRLPLSWVLGLGVLAIAGCSPPPPPPEAIRPVTLYQVVVGGAGLAAYSGEVRPRHETDLAFRIPGKLVRRTVDVGTRVRRGDEIARLDAADVALQVDAARAAVAAAEADYRFAESEYARYRDLHERKFVSASALDQRRTAFEAARSRLEQARAELDVRRNQAGYAVLLADGDGVVTAVAAEAGTVVAAGQPVARLARSGEREALISVPENRVGELRQASRIEVWLWADRSKVYRGRVREVAPAVDPVTRTFAVRVAIVDADAAVDLGMTATVSLAGAGTPRGVLVPATAIHRHADQAAVWIFDPAAHTVALRGVRVVQFREDGVLIGEGLAPGEWVVAAGVHKLQPGQRVRPYETSAASPASGPTGAATPAVRSSRTPAAP